MTTLPDDYARCHGRTRDGNEVVVVTARPHDQCADCLRCNAPMRDNVLYSYMAPPEFTTTCPERLAP